MSRFSLVIGGSDSEEKLRANVRELAEKFLAQPQFALEREQLRQALGNLPTGRVGDRRSNRRVQGPKVHPVLEVAASNEPRGKVSVKKVRPHPNPLPRGEGEMVAAIWPCARVKLALVQGFNERVLRGRLTPAQGEKARIARLSASVPDCQAAIQICRTPAGKRPHNQRSVIRPEPLPHTSAKPQQPQPRTVIF